MEQPTLNSHNKEEHRPSHTAEHLLNQTMVRMFGNHENREKWGDEGFMVCILKAGVLNGVTGTTSYYGG